MAIQIDQAAPDFELPSNQLVDGRPGKKIKLSDLRGKPVVLAFYPLDFSPTCTTENVCFRDDLSKFNELGAQVLGISVDSAWTHKAFAEAHKLTFPLLADPDHAVADQYGAWQERSMYGRKYMGVARLTYLIGPDGRVVRRWDGVKVDGHADEVLAAVQAL